MRAVVLISPSNPLVSVGTILALAGVRDALRTTDATIVGVSPIVGGATIKGPADRMMRGLGMEVSAVGVARAYADFLDVLVIDQQDADLAAGVEAEGVRAVVTDTIMRDPGREAGAGAGSRWSRPGSDDRSLQQEPARAANLGGRPVQRAGREQAPAGRLARPDRARAPEPGDARRRPETSCSRGGIERVLLS